MRAIDSLEQEATSGGRVMMGISLKIVPERGKMSPPVRSKKKNLKKSTFSVSLETAFYVMIMCLCVCINTAVFPLSQCPLILPLFSSVMPVCGFNAYIYI